MGHNTISQFHYVATDTLPWIVFSFIFFPSSHFLACSLKDVTSSVPTLRLVRLFLLKKKKRFFFLSTMTTFSHLWEVLIRAEVASLTAFNETVYKLCMCERRIHADGGIKGVWLFEVWLPPDCHQAVFEVMLTPYPPTPLFLVVWVNMC